MANEGERRFSGVQRLFFLRIVIGVLAAGVLGLVLFFVVNALPGTPFADALSKALQAIGLPQYLTGWFYHSVILNVVVYVVPLLIAVVAIVFLYQSLARVTKYLDQISHAAKRLVIEEDSDVVLYPELKPLQDDFNLTKLALRERAKLVEEEQRKRNDLIVYLAHDIRTPLTSTMGYLALLNDRDDLTPRERKEYTEIALRKAQRLDDLLNEFFEITQYTVGGMRLEMETVNFSRLALQYVEEIAPICAEKQLAVEADIEPGLFVQGDATKLLRVIENLMKNAVAYSFEDTTLVLSAFGDEDGIVFTIENEGDTIPADKLEVIFDRFYRLDAARTTDDGGAGLGLAIAREITNLHGGRLIATSAEGITRFELVLPFTS